jgi:hypothetical protein
MIKDRDQNHTCELDINHKLLKIHFNLNCLWFPEQSNQDHYKHEIKIGSSINHGEEVNTFLYHCSQSWDSIPALNS